MKEGTAKRASVEKEKEQGEKWRGWKGGAQAQVAVGDGGAGNRHTHGGVQECGGAV